MRLRDVPHRAALSAQLRLARRAGSAAGGGGGGADAGVSEQVKHLYVFAAAKAGMRQSDEERKRCGTAHGPLASAPCVASARCYHDSTSAGLAPATRPWAEEALTLAGLRAASTRSSTR